MWDREVRSNDVRIAGWCGCEFTTQPVAGAESVPVWCPGCETYVTDLEVAPLVHWRGSHWHIVCAFEMAANDLEEAGELEEKLAEQFARWLCKDCTNRWLALKEHHPSECPECRSTRIERFDV